MLEDYRTDGRTLFLKIHSSSDKNDFQILFMQLKFRFQFSDASSSDVLLQPCGQRQLYTHSLHSSGRYMTVVFTTDGTTENTGFLIGFQIYRNNGLGLFNRKEAIALFLLACMTVRHVL